jgi:hypothetical protein
MKVGCAMNIVNDITATTPNIFNKSTHNIALLIRMGIKT